ncbi:uncharacterized protein LOC111924041 isoform X1 [Cyanistes caeruleus]|uniref:uncharacterized protein LOC111924041 isoform X1 n=1 Tax=Cyanistes caeruleus TaxID=156563 RepID=UPI000CDB6932|nr:uncharacterized protein LOC111924041 isoform X1 [Cyanistes caeruleus]
MCQRRTLQAPRHWTARHTTPALKLLPGPLPHVLTAARRGLCTPAPELPHLPALASRHVPTTTPRNRCPNHVFFQSQQRPPSAAGRAPELGLRHQQVVDGLEGGGSCSAVLTSTVWLDVHTTSPHRRRGARPPP